MGRIIPYSYIIENKKCLKSPANNMMFGCAWNWGTPKSFWNGNITRNTLEVSKFQRNPEPEDTLWYRKLPFIVSFPIENMVIFHSYVSLPEGTRMFTFSSLDLATSYVLFFFPSMIPQKISSQPGVNISWVGKVVRFSSFSFTSFGTISYHIISTSLWQSMLEHPIAHRIHVLYIYMLTLGVYWW